MRKLLVAFIALFLCTVALPKDSKAQTNEKVGVLFSDTIENYADATYPGGTVKIPFATSSVTVSPKGDLSSIHDKALKMYHFYEQEGYDVAKVDHNVLNSLDKMHEYDVLVFPYFVLMNHTQRENLKAYIYGGGNAQFLFDTGRNELAKIPKNSSQMDLTPLIYDVLTWVWEWDNLTEVYQARFIDDVQLKNSTITNTPGVTHPILTKAYAKLGRNSIQLNNKSNEWFEIIQPWNASVKPLLVISNFDSTDKPANVKKGQSGALFAIEHGAGRVVYSPFKIYDFINVEAEDADWHDGTKGNAWDQRIGDEDAKAILTASLDWLLEGTNTFKPRNYDVKLELSNTTANITPQKTFAVRGTVTATNVGNIPARGKLKVQVLDANNKSLGQYEKTLVGLSPSPNESSSYAEKFEILLPGSTKDGKYNVKVTFEETRHDRSGYVTRAEALTLTKQGNKGSFTSFANFKDVSSANGHYKNIMNAAKIGIITGYADQTFKPIANVSRLNAMMMMLRAIGVSPSASATLPSSVTDLKKGVYGYDVMATAYQLGLIELDNGQIAKDAPMRRGAMAQTLVKGFKLQGKSELVFTDIQSNNIETLYHHRITTGKTATLYGPNDAVTRQQFATFIMRSLENTSK